MKTKYVNSFKEDKYYYLMSDFPKTGKDSKGREYEYKGSVDKNRCLPWKIGQTLKVIGTACLIIPLIVPKYRRNLGLKLKKISSSKEEVRYYVPTPNTVQENHKDMKSSLQKEAQTLKLSLLHRFTTTASLIEKEQREIKEGVIFGLLEFAEGPQLITVSFNEYPEDVLQQIVEEMESSFTLDKGICKRIGLVSVCQELDGGYFARLVTADYKGRRGIQAADKKEKVVKMFSNAIAFGFENPGNLEF